MLDAEKVKRNTEDDSKINTFNLLKKDVQREIRALRYFKRKKTIYCA